MNINTGAPMRPNRLGTSKVWSLVRRPHSIAVVGLSAFMWSPVLIGYQTEVATVGFALSWAMQIFVGKETDAATRKLERFNMCAFSLLFALLAFNVVSV
ncbi:hypothetical protein LU11_gp313 [Pseudomonas phage Lu11]|uniref:hypothetical protein n=1 Tax=Pseudomonas phage Lu11 TaxID=1161927 RepID=UPI00025F1863|nr:hypothetical protein LU11_gp313 [Pseudomonas phage Lu11]AFH14844.1 hypothetical protein Lu11_0306 [Pseudomonas phage Lu11]